MATPSKKKKIQTSQSKRAQAAAGVPQENVLDLRSRIQERSAATVPAPKKHWGWFKTSHTRLEKIDLPQRTTPASITKSVELPVTRITDDIKEELINFEGEPEDEVIVETEPVTIIERLEKKAEQAEEVLEDKVEEWVEEGVTHVRRLTPKQAWVAISIFALLGLAVLAPTGISHIADTAKAVQGDVLSLATTGFHSFESATTAATNQSYGQAVEDFTLAEDQFSAARERLNGVSRGLVNISKYLPGAGSEPATVDRLLLIGEHVSGAGLSVSQSAQLLSGVDMNALRQNDSLGLTTVLVALHATLRAAQDHLSIASLATQDVDVADLPPEVQDKVNLLLTNLPTAQTEIDSLVQAIEVALGVLGHDEPRRYLVLFQNNRELRATGGFLGSFALLDVDKGVVKKITIPGGGIYDVAGQVSERVQAPKPLQLVNPYWNIQDANWWPDFPTSAKKVEWFWGKAGGPSVDGVITLTPDVIENLLRLTGPIDLTETYGMVIDANNFYETVQLQAEEKYDATNQSKKILADLTPILFNQLFSLEGQDLLGALEVLEDSLSQKDILLYSDEDILQREILSAGWGGQLASVPGDYLMVVDTNIGGGKTDGVIDETISHHVKIDHQGIVTNTVQITRHHRSIPGDPLTGVNNWDYLRLYVPQGSQLVSAQGFTEPPAENVQLPDPSVEIDADYLAISGDVLQEEQTGMRLSEEFGKTVFANWLETRPGESTSVSVTYTLPFTAQTGGWFEDQWTYSLFIQKQPGSFDPYVVVSMDVPDEWQVVSASPEGAQASLGLVLDTDEQVEVVFEQP